MMRAACDGGDGRRLGRWWRRGDDLKGDDGEMTAMRGIFCASREIGTRGEGLRGRESSDLGLCFPDLVDSPSLIQVMGHAIWARLGWVGHG